MSIKDNKPHKFFTRDLDNNLPDVSETLKMEYARIKDGKMRGVSPDVKKSDLFVESMSFSTQKSLEYNAFQMYYPWMHELYSAVVEMVQEACEYYDVDYNSEQWIAQAWFNINSREKGGKLNWHDHIDESVMSKLDFPAFHGYYSVNAEPSVTHYMINGKQVDNVNKNNRAILSMMGYQHAQGDWDWDGDRITIAYDVTPLRISTQDMFLRAYGNSEVNFWEQHFIPLPRIR